MYNWDINLKHFSVLTSPWGGLLFADTCRSKWKVNLTGHILRRNWLLQRVKERQKGIEVTGRRGRRRRKLLGDLKERRGYSHLKEEVTDRTMWRARFRRSFGSVIRQTTKWMNEHVGGLMFMDNLNFIEFVCICWYTEWPKKCIPSLLINTFGINLNEISISGWECNIMCSQQMAQALL